MWYWSCLGIYWFWWSGIFVYSCESDWSGDSCAYCHSGDSIEYAHFCESGASGESDKNG